MGGARFKRLLAAVVLAIFILSAGGASVHGAGVSGAGLDVAITVTERAGTARVAEPVTVGVPLSRAADIRGGDGLRLLAPDGGVLPAQFTVTARWGGGPDDPALPVKWVLVDFQADVAARASAVYRLVDGGAATPGTSLAVTRNDSDILTISTGPARFSFSKKRFSLFETVTVGSSTLVAAGSDSGVVAVEPGGGRYLSAAGAPEEVALETDGAMRKTVRVRGGLYGPTGELLDCTARISLFADRTDAKVQLTVRNRRDPQVSEGQPLCCEIGCPNSAAFSELFLVLDGPGAGGPSRLGGSGVDALTSSGTLEIYQDSNGGDSWARHRGSNPRPQSYVSFRGYRVYRDGGQVAGGDRPSPWMGVGGAGGAVAASVRGFWQNYPKALEATAGLLEVALFPDRYGGDYSFRPGEQKTHEVLYSFGSSWNAGMGDRALAFQEPLLARAGPEYYLATGALGRVAPVSGDGEAAAYEQLNRATLDGQDNNLLKAIEDTDFYSWQDYGEVPIDYEDGGTGSFNDKYNFSVGLALQFARGGDPRWLDLAVAGARHTADLDVIHTSGTPDNWWELGFFGHCYHDEDNNLNPNRNFGMPHPDLVFGAPGLFLLYNMTGDPVMRQTAVEVSENIHYRFENSFGRGNGEGYANAPDYENDCESGRPFAHGLWVMVEAYRATGDARYLGTAEWIIQNSHLAVDPFLTAPVPGDRRSTKLFVWDLLASSLGRYLDLCAEIGRADGSGAREQLLAMADQETRYMWKVDERGNCGVPYAWMRDGTPWGWEDYEVQVNVCNWHLLTADALAYAVAYGGDPAMLDRAAEAFKTGSNPDIEYYAPSYTATKEATNSANFGMVYMSARGMQPGGEPQFNEWLCLQNAGDSPATANVRYLMGDGDEVLKDVEVPAHSRRTVDVNSEVGYGRDVSATVSSDRPLVVERPMYFDYHGAMAGGHDSVGAAGPALSWYFAEGCTRDGFEEWLTVSNPGDADAHLKITYMLGDGSQRVQEVDARAAGRTTIDVNAFVGPGQDVSALVESGNPVIVERPMYFDYHGWSGGHDSLGVEAPSTSWYFGEGTTRSNPTDGYFEQWLCLQNPGGTPARADVTYLLDSGEPVSRSYDLAPGSRGTVNVNSEVGPDHDVSTVVRSDVPIVAERPLYFLFRGAVDGGDVSMGAAAPRTETYFAEGCTRDGFNTWLCLANPGEEPATVTVEYFTGTGRTLSREVTVQPGTRSTVDVNLDVGAGEDVSIRVSSSGEFLAERPVYFNYHGRWAGGHTSSGAASPLAEWHFAEGCTR
ncbi:MAG: hypothetical protein KKF41_11780 [Actinobacteria bacterium]|nr:hypothetical protein [Actinomycetota bacterium]MBU1944279.1 hypothetical protein [Actinomycetota bacterium]MBU2688255.1 hypothetical protein [Actinomycetota bacterium]